MEITDGVEIHHAGDLPAMTGIGTSSAFTVGLLNALHKLRGEKAAKMQLALEAIHIEQDMIKEHVGSQDQVTSAFGGFNRVDFSDKLTVTPVRSGRLKELEDSLMMFFTGFTRKASQIAGEWIERTPVNRPALQAMYEMVAEGINLLTSGGDLSSFGKLLDESWKLKRTLADRVSSEYIDYLYGSAIDAGASGGKLLGAGGGGFLLLFVEPDKQPSVQRRLSRLLEVPFKFESLGSEVIFYG